METQLSEPYFPMGKSSSMLQAINYFPVNRPNNAIMISDPVESPPETAQSATKQPSILTPTNIMIGAGVICILIVIVKSK